jgi:hypothetical protein
MFDVDLFNAETLTLQEFVMREPLPLSTLQKTVLEFLQGRDDAVLFGAQAVNAYVSEPRMTQDIDLMSPRANELAEELREYLSQKFHIALRVRSVAEGRGYRIFQVQKTGNRHLVDLRSIESLPAHQRIGEILVVTPVELIALKVVSYYQRRGKPKAGTDWRDLALLLLAFPTLKVAEGEVAMRLQALASDAARAAIVEVWQELVALDLQTEADEDEFF